MTSRSFAVSRRIVPPVAATLVFVGGIVLLLSGSLPAEGATDRLFERYLAAALRRGVASPRQASSACC